MMDKINIKRPWLLAIIGFSILVAVIIILWILDMRKTAQLDILIAPKSATITVNNTGYSPGVTRVEPGQYTIEISKDGFDSYSQTVEVISGQTEKIYVQLRPADGDYSWYLNHPEETEYLTAIGDYQYDQRLEEMKRKYPFIKELPINVEYYSADYRNYTKYSINYEVSAEGKVAIRVTDYTGGNQSAANKQITNRGYKLSDYIVEYIDKSSQETWSHSN